MAPNFRIFDIASQVIAAVSAVIEGYGDPDPEAAIARRLAPKRRPGPPTDRLSRAGGRHSGAAPHFGAPFTRS